MAYTTIKKPSDYFNTKLYSGNGSTQDITGVGFQPDLTWLKVRLAGSGQDHTWYDSVRGATKFIESNTTNAEATGSNYLTSFDSDGFTLGNDQSHVNASGDSYASWNWLADNTSGSANTDGSISSTVSANTTSGFSIVSYTGNGTDGATVGHGLTSPKLILIKARTSATPWIMYGYPNHPAFPTDGSLLQLDSTVAMSDSSTKEASIGASTVTFVDAGGDINASGVDFVMYCFQEKTGYSKFGSYVGNGSTDGTFIYTGFKPAMIITKSSSTGGSGYNWRIYDNKRDTFNLVANELQANTNVAEADGGTSGVDFLSNGFKLKTDSGGINQSGVTYIYMCFAEQPLTGTNGVPCTAR